MGLLNSFFGTDQGTATENTTAMDVVTYIASLASEPKAIDPLLEPLREITARLQPGQALPPADQTTLAGVCLRLQEYLVKSDPLRHFDQTDLQSKITKKFPRPAAGQDTFWSKLRT